MTFIITIAVIIIGISHFAITPGIIIIRPAVVLLLVLRSSLSPFAFG